ncbi:MAG: response regulator, partial [Candidatus Aminicenantes bacterium]|nr:response regulator [Candidatus Aminicenantes bacterium]
MDILIVEDEAVLAMVYLQQLRELGYQDVSLAFSGKDALAAVERRRPKLILLDIKLRGARDGIGVAEIIRCRHTVPSVYITAYSDAETLGRAWRTDPVCILGKIGNNGELSRVVSTIMAAERGTSGHKMVLCMS